MCLAVPGKIIAVHDPLEFYRKGTVDFQGSRVEVSLAMVPEAEMGDWVLVHAGLAITRLEESEARETWKYLEEAGMILEHQEDEEHH